MYKSSLINEKLIEIREFCNANTNQKNIDKYSRYFREGFDGYGIDHKVYAEQLAKWIRVWQDELTIDDYLDLGDELMKTGRYEEKSFAISFLESEKENFSEEVFRRIGLWFDYGIDNWGNTDVLCMLILPHFISDRVIDLHKLGEWSSSTSEWKRRAVPVTLVELAKKDLKPEEAFSIVEPLMPDESEYVRKGLGTLLRTIWKSYPEETEAFLMKWKDSCGRLIIQYATEKMDKEYRKKFRKSK